MDVQRQICEKDQKSLETYVDSTIVTPDIAAAAFTQYVKEKAQAIVLSFKNDADKP